MPGPSGPSKLDFTIMRATNETKPSQILHFKPDNHCGSNTFGAKTSGGQIEQTLDGPGVMYKL